MIYTAEFFVIPVLIATQQTEMMLKFARVGRYGQPAREPFLRNLPPPLLLWVQFHEACSFLPDRGDVLKVERRQTLDCIGGSRHLGF